MTTTELAVHQGGALAITPDQQQWTPQQVAVLRQLGLQDASPADLDIFHHQCQRTGLDPFARQIYMIGRWSREGTKYTIQTSIDGLRLVGHRAASARRETLEVSDTEWCGPDGVWRDVWLSDEPPAAARVAILRNGGRFPAVAMFREYAQTKKDGNLTQMWSDKGALMIAKCAEALAWRKAFPQDLSGIYTSDEMGQATAPTRHTVTQQRVGRDDLIAQAQAAAEQPVDWIGRVQACETVDELRTVWAAANAAGALDDELRDLLTAAVSDLQQVDEQTGEVL